MFLDDIWLEKVVFLVSEWIAVSDVLTSGKNVSEISGVGWSVSVVRCAVLHSLRIEVAPDRVAAPANVAQRVNMHAVIA